MRDLENQMYEQELEARESAHERAVEGEKETFVCACGQRQRVSRDADEYPDAVTCELCGEIMKPVAPGHSTPRWLRSWLDSNKQQNFDHTMEEI